MGDLMGLKARDKNTGFEGMVTAKVEYLNVPTPSYRIETLLEGKIVEQWFDEGRIEPVI